ncbi:hypothetical protein MuYL_4712 [Mucilaginibacter xinganensis]|uniref:Uncharacterized protein n=1 Tax=Mucilaginibacter xinganensis TaxID=1234841 RepID=A0A223P3B0_9SPHI|nr:hypothetical protein MuYL_4712 [Mucilaginibacter xinganensis]
MLACHFKNFIFKVTKLFHSGILFSINHLFYSIKPSLFTNTGY